jgi:alpha-galactosidase
MAAYATTAAMVFAGPAGKNQADAKEAWVRENILNVELKVVPPKPVVKKPVEPGLTVLANNDPVQLNAKGGKPMKIGTKEYTRGLYCHAVSRVVVRLPGPGKTFSAMVGVDANNAPEINGSVVFSVSVGDKVAFRSDTLRGKTEGVPVNVDLGGATEFILDAGDAGDGIGWDHANWADAKVTLADGKDVWLGEMPIRDERIDVVAPEPAERSSRLPFSFIYRGLSSDALLAEWPGKTSTEKVGSHATRQVRSWTEPATGLEVRWVIVDYADFPAVEWTVYFKNTGTNDTAILESIQGLDTRLERGKGGEFVLHGNKGDWCTADSFAPFSEPLGPQAVKKFASFGGRPTNHAWPYYNLQFPGGGVFVAIGWPGQWASSFVRDEAAGLRVVAGQELTHLVLKPGEEIRSPLAALVFWQGTDLVSAQNLWRRWMLAHNLPRTADGKLPPPQIVACSSHQFAEMTQANEENQKLFVDRYLEEGMKLDYWWMDAGWYPCGGDWTRTGTWEPDKARFPKGLRAVSDHAHAKGVKIITWFEPERVGDRTSWLGKNHPEWLLGISQWALLNLGHPEALSWLINHVDRTLTEQGIDFYRQDFNMDPLDCWRGNDTTKRQGMTENLYVQGYLKYWDALRERHPQLRIDSCASGGRRDDLETMRRAVPLIRSDYLFEPTSQQCHHRQFAQWIPYHGAGYVTGQSAIGGRGTADVEAYGFRANMSASLTLCYDVRSKTLNYALAKRLFDQLRQIGPNFLGDFYPLTDYSLANTAWMAWQYDRPEAGEGMVEAFRRPDCGEAEQTYRLRGLDPAATYEVLNLDVEGSTKVSGKELMEKGLAVEIKDKPGAAVIVYKKK